MDIPQLSRSYHTDIPSLLKRRDNYGITTAHLPDKYGYGEVSLRNYTAFLRSLGTMGTLETMGTWALGAIWCQLVPFGARCLDCSIGGCNLVKQGKQFKQTIKQTVLVFHF